MHIVLKGAPSVREQAFTFLSDDEALLKVFEKLRGDTEDQAARIKNGIMDISTLDYFAQGIVNGDPKICNFKDCLGMFIAVSPTGDLFHCQRFCGSPEYALGNLSDIPGLAQLYESEAARKIKQREAEVQSCCAPCEYAQICKGSCYYNALSSGDGENPLLRKGVYISLSGSVHPSKIANNARRILAIRELGATGDPAKAAQNLFEQHVCGQPEVTEKLLIRMKDSLSGNGVSFNNFYSHVTWNCNLRCDHCYACAGEKSGEMGMADFERSLTQALEHKFRQFIITGGEPLVHSRRAELIDICSRHRGKGMNLVLRTNRTGDFKKADFIRLAEAFDQVVVSEDGSEETHDARRGKGTYLNVVKNLKSCAGCARDIPGAAELSLACVMGAAAINGSPGESVRRLGKRLAIRRVRFRPLLPLGRAARLDEPVMCEGIMQHVPIGEILKTEFRPMRTCGIGQNLFVTPDGGAYPCYAWHGRTR